MRGSARARGDRRAPRSARWPRSPDRDRVGGRRRRAVGRAVAARAAAHRGAALHVVARAAAARPRRSAGRAGDPAEIATTVASVLLIVACGTPLAWLIARGPGGLWRVLETVIQLPVVMPPAVAGVALLLAFGRRGLLGPALAAFGVGLPFSSAAVVLAQLFVAAPFYVQAAIAAFRRLDPDLVLVARTLGASRPRVFFTVALPLSRPALAGGAALSWARALGEFGATLMFAGNLTGRTQTLPLTIYTALESDLQTAQSLSIILVAVAFALLWRSARAARRWSGLDVDVGGRAGALAIDVALQRVGRGAAAAGRAERRRQDHGADDDPGRAGPGRAAASASTATALFDCARPASTCRSSSARHRLRAPALRAVPAPRRARQRRLRRPRGVPRRARRPGARGARRAGRVARLAARRPAAALRRRDAAGGARARPRRPSARAADGRAARRAGRSVRRDVRRFLADASARSRSRPCSSRTIVADAEALDGDIVVIEAGAIASAAASPISWPGPRPSSSASSSRPAPRDPVTAQSPSARPLASTSADSSWAVAGSRPGVRRPATALPRAASRHAPSRCRAATVAGATSVATGVACHPEKCGPELRGSMHAGARRCFRKLSST